MASSVSEVLVPLKFLLVMLQLILVIMILATKVRAPTPPLSLSHSLIAQDEYILAELGPGSSTSSGGYSAKNIL